MKPVFEPSVKTVILDRIGRLSPQSRPRFGKMNVNQMVVHCTGGIQMLIGELEIPPVKSPFKFAPLRYLIIHVLPWPHGAPTASELIPPANPGDFAANVQKLKSALERISAKPDGPFTPHPAFGALKGNDIGVLVARHLHHHLSQFGV